MSVLMVLHHPHITPFQRRKNSWRRAHSRLSTGNKKLAAHIMRRPQKISAAQAANRFVLTDTTCITTENAIRQGGGPLRLFSWDRWGGSAHWRIRLLRLCQPNDLFSEQNEGSTTTICFIERVSRRGGKGFPITMNVLK